MTEEFFSRPILNSPYAYPGRHWELDKSGQPTNKVLDNRRLAEFITPIPKPKKRKKSKQQELIYDEGAGRVALGSYPPRATWPRARYG